MDRPQVLVISFDRLTYLKETVAGLRQDPIRLLIVDGGTEEGPARPETRAFIKAAADEAIFLEGNPGADVLKTTGIKRMIDAPEFLIVSDDIGVPKGYTGLCFKQYQALNRDGLKWTFVACPTPDIVKRYDYGKRGYGTVNGVQVMAVASSQVCCAIIDTAVCEKVGYFPAYGRSGEGDRAFSRRLIKRGLRVGYWLQPIAQHLGTGVAVLYPEYKKRKDADERLWAKRARSDSLGDKADVT